MQTPRMTCRTFTRFALIVAATLSAALASACGHHQAPAKSIAGSATSHAVAAYPPAAGFPMTVTVLRDVVIAPSILRACELPSEPEDAPMFDTDSSVVRARGEEILRRAAHCLTSGPLRGSAILLVGHADPRGEAAYNDALAEARARSVYRELAALGVPESQMLVTSRGELDATGTDSASWAVDRRVEVELIPAGPSGGPAANDATTSR